MDYQQKVKEAFASLQEARIQVFTALINVAMASEYKEVDDLFAEDEFFSFRTSDFDHAEDPNVGILLNAVKRMEIAEEEMISWNGKNYLDSEEQS